MKRTRWIPLIVYAALLVAFLGWISNLFTTGQDTLPYSKVVELFNKEQVRQFVVQDQTITMQLNKPLQRPDHHHRTVGRPGELPAGDARDFRGAGGLRRAGKLQFCSGQGLFAPIP